MCTDAKHINIPSLYKTQSPLCHVHLTSAYISHGRHPVFEKGQKCRRAFVKGNDRVKMLNTNGLGAFFCPLQMPSRKKCHRAFVKGNDRVTYMQMLNTNGKRAFFCPLQMPSRI